MRKQLFLVACLFWVGFGLSYAQSTISGRVFSTDTGEPIIGATVMVAGQAGTGTITDFDGNFSITVPNASARLVFSYMGYLSVELAAHNGMTVRLQPDARALDEVVVTAYGTVARSSFTGAAGVVTSQDIGNRQVSNLSRALEGTIPGLQVAASGGQPGSDATMRIRGYGSLAAGNAPLIVLDGAVFNGSLNSINPSDIESITVLRDAASAALYGSRAANGVIIVTTKRGQNGKSKVNIDVRQGVNVRGQAFYETLSDPGEFLETAWRTYYNDNIIAGIANPGQNASATLAARLYNPFIGGMDIETVDENGNLVSGLVRRWNDNWVDELFRVGYRNEVNMSVSSGTENSTTFFSLGYLGDEGIVRATDFDRFSLRLNSTYDITNNFKVGANLAYSRTEQNQVRSATNNTAASNAFGFINGVAPIYPVYLYDMEGNKMLGADGRPLFDFGDREMPGVPGRRFSANQNPVAMTVHDKNRSLEDNVSARGMAEYAFLNGFRFTANLAYDVRNRANNIIFSPLFGDAKGIGGRVQKRVWRTETMTATQLLHYARTFGLHNVSALAGHETYAFNQSYMYVEGLGMFLPDVGELDNTTEMSTMTSYGLRKAIQSYLSQLLYNYNERYYFSASFRRDGSSVFLKNRWGNFWSVGGSWRISEEDFMAGITEINNLRLRASYGTSGNDLILDNDGVINYLPYDSQFELDPSGGLTHVYEGNPDLKWEKNNNFNVGFDAGLFNNRLRVEFDYYIRNSSDLLYNRPVAISKGYSFRPENNGSMKNTGIEFTIAGDVVRTRDFDWTVTLIGGYNKNEITSLPKDSIASGMRLRRIGGTIYDYYLLEYAGVDPNNGNALWYYTNDEGEKVATDDTSLAETGRITAGSALPDFVGGLNMAFRYKNFDLSVLTNFQIGGKVFDGTYQNLMGADANLNWHTDIRKAWTEENRFTDVPRVGDTYQNANNQSTRFLIGADFFNIRSIVLGYSVPASLLQNTGLTGIRVSLSGDNVVMFSKRKGMDPRQSLSSGIDGMSNIAGNTQNAYTPISTYSIGVSLSF